MRQMPLNKDVARDPASKAQAGLDPSAGPATQEASAHSGSERRSSIMIEVVPMQTLLEILPVLRGLGSREAIRSYNGYRTYRLTYGQLYDRIAAAAGMLEELGLEKGNRLVLWGENGPEWVAVFWACLARGIHVVPVDFHSSPQFVQRISEKVEAKALFHGDDLDPGGTGIPTVTFWEVAQAPIPGEIRCADVEPEDVAQIVFTSGSTGDPKGVVHRHRNICANLTPMKREIDRWKWLATPFQPLRLLTLLPLSHLFGQATGILVPPILGGGAVFTNQLMAGGIAETIRRERVSVLVSVPRLLTNLQADLARRFGAVREHESKGLAGAARSWFDNRRVHRALGWKFWAIVAGGAQLPTAVEVYWRRLGFVVVQGYGLTESSPVVSVNHPFHTRHGSIGKAVAGQEVMLAPDGEILVRGESVVQDYFGGAETGGTPVHEGWLHTGDMGELDAEGNLYFRGRRKEMIVTAEGLNVYPEDVEAALSAQPGVLECAVVPAERAGRERVHAVVIPRDEGVDVAAVIQQANRELEAHQRIQSWSVWPGARLPRTASTMKVQRGKVAAEVGAEQSGEPPAGGAVTGGGSPVVAALSEITGRRPEEIGGELDLETGLGLSSLDRVELLSRLEAEYGTRLDEETFAGMRTVAEVQEHFARVSREPVVATREGMPEAPTEREGAAEPAVRPAQSVALLSRRVETPEYAVLPRWNRKLPARVLQLVLVEGLAAPMFRRLVRLRVKGLEHLASVTPPVLFIANHNSHFDPVAIYAALPFRLRRRLMPAMSQDYFRAYFEPAAYPWKQRLKFMAQFYLATGLFNAYPLPQRMAGTRRALRYSGELIDDGYCPLVFPEGLRSPSGRMLPFMPGIGLMATRLGVPVVPIHIQGLFKVYSVHHEWPEAGDVRVRFGEPMLFGPREEYGQVAKRLEGAVRGLGATRLDRRLPRPATRA